MSTNMTNTVVLLDVKWLNFIFRGDPMLTFKTCHYKQMNLFYNINQPQESLITVMRFMHIINDLHTLKFKTVLKMKLVSSWKSQPIVASQVPDFVAEGMRERDRGKSVVMWLHTV